MASFPCPYCGHAVVAGDSEEERQTRCPSCDGGMQIAYRYRLVAYRGEISGGVLYEAVDDIFGEKVAVLFVADRDDAAAVDRFIEGNRLFADLGGRGLVKIRELSNRSDSRPYVVMDWIAAGTLESVVAKRGPLDQATLIELIGDLLTGLSKAHRSMPAIVHGHIHPGKIGFLSSDEIVLFGFEWAQQVFEQDSHLADAFVAEGEDEQVSRASDLRQLGIAVFYAATGEWISDQALARQRARVRERMGGPLGAAVDRMLGAGIDGYHSAVDAYIDLEDLLGGSSRWAPRVRRRQNRSGDLRAKAWSQDDPAGHLEEAEEYDEAIEEISDDQLVPLPAPPTADPFAEFRARQQAQAQGQVPQASASKPNAGRIVAIMVGTMLAFGMCVAGIVEDIEDEIEQPQVVVTAPHRTQPQPQPPPQPPPLPPEVLQDLEDANRLLEDSAQPVPLPVPSRPVLSGLHRYTGTITGPEDIAGLELDERCEVWVEPHDSSLNCRWYIDCGSPRRRIYGGGDVGYSTCQVEDGHPLMAQDEDDDAPDGAFMAVLSERDAMVLVQDRWLLPPTRVLISIEDGGPHPGPIPAVPLAARQSRASIEAALQRGEYPSYR
jgi:hypothetical protein